MYRDEYLRKQVADAHRPIDLFNNEYDAFVCPSCSHQLSLTQSRCIENKYEKSLVLSKCAECHKQLYFKLPEIKKKRIYLDQSILSDLYDVEVLSTFKIDSNDWRERLLTKIKLAKRLQKASFIISDIHVLETVPLPDQAKKAVLWTFTNALADGNIAGDMNDAIEYDLQQLLGKTSLQSANKSPLNCYMNVEVDSWSIRSPILRTNSWRLRLNDPWIEFRKASQENFTHILETQRQQVSPDTTLGRCIEHLKELYLKDVLAAVNYCQILTSRQPKVFELPPKNGYASLIFQATRNYQDEPEQSLALNKLDYQIKLCGLDAFPSLKLQAILEAEVLFKWIQGLRTNPKLFNANYGASKIMDISHLAVFLPTVDVLTLDRDTFNRCQISEIKAEIDKHSTKLLRTTEEEQGLENWLDELLAAPETDEFRCARRLFFGRNLVEEKLDDEKMYREVYELVTEKFKNVSPSKAVLLNPTRSD